MTITRRRLLGHGVAAVAASGLAACREDGERASPPSAEPAPVVDEFCAIGFFTPHESRTVDAMASRILPGTPEDPGAHEAGVLNYIDCLLAVGGFAEPVYMQGPFPAPDADPDTDAIELPEGIDPAEVGPLITDGELESGPESLPVEPQTGQLEALRDDSIESSSFGVIPIPKGRFDRYGWQSLLTPPEIYRRGIRSLDEHSVARFGAQFADLDAEQQDSVLTALEQDEATQFDAPSGQGFFEQVRRHVIEGMFADPIHGGNRDFAGWNLVGYPGAYRAWTADEVRAEGARRAPQSIADLHRTTPGTSHREEPTLPVAGSEQLHRG
ncbi:MAG TPA: gluconate 2-dehydrogenase subunit 3 family protein [Acidimicrobiales bacterium]